MVDKDEKATEFMHSYRISKVRLLFGLEIVEQDGSLLRFLAPVTDDDAGAVDDFASVPFAVESAWFKEN